MITPEQKDLLLRQAKKDKSLTHLLNWAQNGSEPLNVVGVNASHKALLLSLLQHSEQKPQFLIVPDDLTARSMLNILLAFFEPERVLWLRGRPLNFIDTKAQSRDGERSRLAALNGMLQGAFDVIIASPQTLVSRLPEPAAFKTNSLTVRLGQRLDVMQLEAALAGMGYEKVTRVTEAGHFARRGDIVDIGLAKPFDDDCSGIRLSFFDDEVDDLRHFDVETQRAVGPVETKQAAIFPAAEVLLQDDLATLADAIRDAGDHYAKEALRRGLDRETAASRRQLAERDADAISEGVVPSAIDRWLPLIRTMSASALDYAQAIGARLVVDEMARTQQRIAAAQADQLHQFSAMLEQGHVLPLAEEATWSARTILPAIGNTDGALAMAELPGSGLAGGETILLRSLPQERFQGRDEDLIKTILRQRELDMDVWLTAQSQARYERLNKLLLDHGIDSPDIRLVQVPLKNGIVWADAGLSVFGEEDIFGAAKPKVRRIAKGLTIDLLSDLAPGELVVHEDHGIGRYEGLKRLVTSSGARDYLKIRYADAELHIAMERLDQIQKYVAAGEKAPKLSKMGGVEWQNRKSRARESIRRLAVNLVELYARRRAAGGHAFSEDTVWQTEFEDQFEYEETPAQVRTMAEIKADMEAPHVMDRLLCGDVGFGKTELCFRAMFKSVMDGKQAALLAPTTVLAEQHFHTLRDRLEGFPVSLAQLSRFVPRHERNKVVKSLKDGQLDMVVGTHRMLSKDVQFKDLGLLIVDEEQRFGVDHKEKLKAMYPHVDVLSLTATPIPRTLHMSLSGIRDISILEEGPDNRRPIQTYVMTYDAELLKEAMQREIGREGQVFYLYNNTHKIEGKVAALREQLPGARIAIAHGKMSETILEQVISDFIDGEYDILCCTTIIESGIDMPNVNTLIVEDADKLGLAQLYQIRGRIGRSDRQAYAYITYDGDKALTEIAQKRLTAIRDFTALGSGFKIALKDLEVRGAGNLLGGEQSGHLEAIGYDLYTRMLDEEVKSLQGTLPVEKKPSALIEIETDAFLSERYIDDPAARIDLYRKIAAIETTADRFQIEDELIDRFGDIPKETSSLLDIAYIRSFAERHGMTRIAQQNADIVLWLDEGTAPALDYIAVWLQEKTYRGRILFNAGHRPHILFRRAAADKKQTAAVLKTLFELADKTPVQTPPPA